MTGKAILVTQELIDAAGEHGACDYGLETASAYLGRPLTQWASTYKVDAIWWLLSELCQGDAVAAVSKALGMTVHKNKDGKLHCEGGPAVVHANGTSVWYLDGQLQRADGPAILVAGGGERWYRRNDLHRADGPAVCDPNGLQEWWLHGQRHREDGPAVVRPDGVRKWFRRGKLHREDGPAVVRRDGVEVWYKHGKPIPSPIEGEDPMANGCNA